MWRQTPAFLVALDKSESLLLNVFRTSSVVIHMSHTPLAPTQSPSMWPPLINLFTVKLNTCPSLWCNNSASFLTVWRSALDSTSNITSMARCVPVAILRPFCLRCNIAGDLDLHLARWCRNQQNRFLHELRVFVPRFYPFRATPDPQRHRGLTEHLQSRAAFCTRNDARRHRFTQLNSSFKLLARVHYGAATSDLVGAEQHVYVVLMLAAVTTIATSPCSAVARTLPTVEALKSCSSISLTITLFAKLTFSTCLPTCSAVSHSTCTRAYSTMSLFTRSLNWIESR